jgi:hypothetical protein
VTTCKRKKSTPVARVPPRITYLAHKPTQVHELAKVNMLHHDMAIRQSSSVIFFLATGTYLNIPPPWLLLAVVFAILLEGGIQRHELFCNKRCLYYS